MRLTDLWTLIRNQSWFQQLPEPIRDSPLLALLLGVLGLGIALVMARRLVVLMVASRRGPRAVLLAEIAELKAAGEWTAVGDRYRSLGQNRAALRAYRRAGDQQAIIRFHSERGELHRARKLAHEAELWESYGELCELQQDFIEAGSAFERVSRWHRAATCYRQANEIHDAARCLIEGGMEAEAASLLLDSGGASSATLFEVAIRASLDRSRGAPLSQEMAMAVSKCAQLLIENDETERAFDLAVDTHQLELAVPLARDFLGPTAERAEVCIRAGAILAAADIYQKIGDHRNEALLRADHETRRENHLAAATWFEQAGETEQAAELFAAGGDTRRAAEIYERLGQLKVAAELYDQIGDHNRQSELLALASVRPPEDDSDRTVIDGPSGRHDLERNGGLINDRYELGEPIGRGGMGVVYRAKDRLLDRDVAFKVLPARLLDEHDLLLGEARAAARLSHPNIVQVYDLGRSGSGLFIVMELVLGGTLSDLLRDRRLTIRGAIGLGRQVCSALGHAHSRNIVHRDLKPSNLLCGERNQIKLTDFGLARLLEEDTGKIETRPAGTPHYMAPEQIRGDAIGPRTDLYSLGCLLFRVTCGRGPFEGKSSVYDHLHSSPVEPREIRSELPAELSDLILNCLEKDPSRRPANADEIGRRLSAIEL